MYGPPPSDSDSDDYDGMSFGHEFEKVRISQRTMISVVVRIRLNFPQKKTVRAPPPRKREDIVSDELIRLLKGCDSEGFRRVYAENHDLIDLNRPLVRYGWTPLMIACQVSLLELVKFLVDDKQVDVNKSVDTWTPLLLACSAKNEHDDAAADDAMTDRVMEIVKLLVDHKALVNVRNRNGETALMLAIMNGHDAVAEYLMANDASLEVSDTQGNTPLFYACTYNRKRMVESLMRQGIIYDIANRRGDRPLDIAISKGFDDIADMFPVQEVEPTVPLDYLNFEGVEELIPTAFPHREK